MLFDVQQNYNNQSVDNKFYYYDNRYHRFQNNVKVGQQEKENAYHLRMTGIRFALIHAISKQNVER